MKPETNTRTGLYGLDVYRVSLDFYRELLGVIERVGNDHVTRQGKRAAESVLLNIGEAHPARRYCSQ